MKKRYVLPTLLTALLLLCLFAFWRGNTPSSASAAFWVYGSTGNAATKIVPADAGEVPLLALPATADPSALPVCFDLWGSTQATASGAAGSVEISSGDIVDLTALCGAEAPWILTLMPASGEYQYTVRLCQAYGLAAMYLTSADPARQGRRWVEGCDAHENSATGSLYMQDALGQTVYKGALTQLRGRGNSTWTADKKPYQIKLEHKTDLLQSGDGANSRKTWVLLANAFDPTLLRNTLVYDLAGAMGMTSFMESRQVNLYYDGEYLGVYQLCEKVGVNPGRVEIRDLEESNQRVNTQSLSSLPIASDVTENSAVYYYRSGMSDPEDITGGYLLETEFSDRVSAEDCYFVTSRGSVVVVKSPEYCSMAQMRYIATLYQSYEDAAYSGGTDPFTGKSLPQLMDITSLAQYYLICEWTKNPDGFSTSCYISKDSGEGHLVMGPVWDYDLALGLGHTSTPEECQQPEGWFTACSGIAHQLIQCEAFREAVCQVFTDTMLPILQSILQAGDSTAPPGSLSWYESTFSTAAACDTLRWASSNPAAADWQSGIKALREFMTGRTQWLASALSQWQKDQVPPILQFLDVPPAAWYYPYVEAVADSGFMRGYVYGRFAPEETITRAQAVVTLYSAAGDRSPVTGATTFTDTAGTDWYAAALAWARTRAIAQGEPDGSFRPNDGLTRQEAAILLYRFVGGSHTGAEVLSSFADGAAITGTGEEALSWAVSAGVLTGYPDGTLRPERITSRGEFAAMLTRALSVSATQ